MKRLLPATVVLLLASALPALALVPVSQVPVRTAAPVDLASVAREDAASDAAGGPWRYAVPREVRITPTSDGLWEDPGDGSRLWRLRVESPGAAHLNLGFTRYRMPNGGRLTVSSLDGTRRIRSFTAADNAPHGELWTPVVLADALLIEVAVPAASRDQLELVLGSINVGYRGFGAKADNVPLSGSCNVDVVCPEGDAWRREIPSVAVISRGGSLNCSGSLVNNTARDGKPYFLTANHCGYTSSNAATFVAYWNYETSVCGGIPDGTLDQFTSGAFWRASYGASDFTLLEIDEPVNAAFKVTYAGWDRSGADAASATAIHHPAVDEKRISFEYQPTTTTSYLGSAVPGDGTHVRIEDWDLGTTEGGSSGSPLFNQDHRVIGQLHGGYASCTSQTSDWYGKFSVSWTGGGTNSSRLSNWLDPVGTGQVALDTLDPNGTCNTNGSCEAGETCDSCPSDCPSGTGPAACGNGVCEIGAGEDCLSCAADCNGAQGGKSRYCCGDGAGTGPVGCSDARCTGNGNTCSMGSGPRFCCGDSSCDAGETGYTCSLDCGAPPVCGNGTCDTAAGENPCSCGIDCGLQGPENCADGRDNDCDGLVDAADGDCVPACVPAGGVCSGQVCCPGTKCRGGTCR